MPDKKHLIDSLTQGWAGDCDKLISIYDHECTFRDKAFDIVHHGHDGLRSVHNFSFTMMPDFNVSYGEPAITDSAGAVEWVFTGSFNGEFEGRSFAGTPVRIEGVSFMTFRDGLIKTNTDYWSLDSLRQQLK